MSASLAAVAITYFQDPEVWAGVRGPATGLLPVPARALRDGATVDTDRFQVALYEAPQAAPVLFQKKAPKQVWTVPEPLPMATIASKVNGSSAVLLPRQLADLLLAAFPRHGAGAATPVGHPAWPRCVEYFCEHMADRRAVRAGVNGEADVSAAVLAYNLELLRLLGASVEGAVALLAGTPEGVATSVDVIRATLADGLCPFGA